MGKSIAFALASIRSLACRDALSVQPDYFPTDGWRTKAPHDLGIDRSVLDALHRAFSRGEYGYVDGMLIVRNGYIVYEKSYTLRYDRANEGARRRHPSFYYDASPYP